jgi:hypothetical protein
VPGIPLAPNPVGSAWLPGEFPGADGWHVACVEAAKVKFCLADDSEPRQWDNNGGRDFEVPEPGVWVLHDSKLVRIDVTGHTAPEPPSAAVGQAGSDTSHPVPAPSWPAVAAIVGESDYDDDGILAPWPAPGPLTDESAGLALVCIQPAPLPTMFAGQPIDGPGIFRLCSAKVRVTPVTAEAPSTPTSPPDDEAGAKAVLLKKLTQKKGRPLQPKHGTRANPHCHRITHEMQRKIALEHGDTLTYDQLRQLTFIDGDTRQAPEKHNKRHEKLELELKHLPINPPSKLWFAPPPPPPPPPTL